MRQFRGSQNPLLVSFPPGCTSRLGARGLENPSYVVHLDHWNVRVTAILRMSAWLFHTSECGSIPACRRAGVATQHWRREFISTESCGSVNMERWLVIGIHHISVQLDIVKTLGIRTVCILTIFENLLFFRDSLKYQARVVRELLYWSIDGTLLKWSSVQAWEHLMLADIACRGRVFRKFSFCNSIFSVVSFSKMHRSSLYFDIGLAPKILMRSDIQVQIQWWIMPIFLVPRH